MSRFRIYCDESCHLIHDGHKSMVLGALMCPEGDVARVAKGIRDMKAKHGLSRDLEVKWTKISPGKVDFYKELVSFFFFDEPKLRFRAVVIPDKAALRHKEFGQTHDDFYFKMYWQLLHVLVETEHQYQVFLDIKDTRSWPKTQKLHQTLSNTLHDFSNEVIERVDLVRSEQVELLQLADLLLGAVSFANRGGGKSKAKQAVADEVRKWTKRRLDKSTALAEKTFNIFVWTPQESSGG